MGGSSFFNKLFLLLVFIAVNANALFANSVNDSLKFEAYGLISEGKKAEHINAYIDAEKKYLKAGEIWDKIEEYDEYRAYPFYSLAILYRKMGDYQKSLKNYQRAEVILIQSREEFRYLLSAIYSSMGSLFIDYGDYTKALLYLDKSIEIIRTSKERNERVYSDILMSIAQAYFNQKKYEKAIDYCQTYINSKNSIDHSRFQRLIGSCFIALGKYVEAKTILEKSLDGFKNLPEKYVEVFLIATKAYIRSGELTIAEENLKKAIPLLATNKTRNDKWNIYYFELKGEFLVKKAENSKRINDKQKYLNDALKVIDKALLMNSISKETNKIPYIESEGSFVTPTQVKDLMISRAKILNNIAENYTQLNDKISGRQFQLLSLKTWEATVRFLHDFRISFLEEESKLKLSELHADVYSQGFELAGKLFKETGNEDFFQKMLFFSESGKSSTFLASMNVAQAKNFGGIPDSLLALEKELNLQLLSIEQLIYNARNSSQPDSIFLKECGKNKFNFQQQHDELMLQFERDYPNYYKLKYSDKLISINEIRSKLTNNQALIEYFVDEPIGENDSGSVNILFFTKSGYKFYSKEINY